jgi:hypothetical protein
LAGWAEVEVMAATDGGEMTADGGVVVAAVMTGGTMCMVIVLAEPQVVERRMVAAVDTAEAGVEPNN